MLVRQILKTKSDRVYTISPDSLVSEAAIKLTEAGIGALLVSPGEGRILGVLSERDIVRSLAKGGAAILSATVDSLMTRNVSTARLSDTDKDVLTRMTEGRFRHMPVIEDGKLIGVVTLGDVVKARLDELAMENESMQGMIMGR